MIESARLTNPPLVPRPIEKPAELAHLWLHSHQLLAIGGDGTAYLTSDGRNISAVRDGKRIWAFQLDSYRYKFGIGTDGLIWIEDLVSGSNLYCFNAAGQGGQLTPSARTRLKLKELPVPEIKPREPLASCQTPDATHDEPSLNGPRNQAWRIAIDQPCERDPLESSNGDALVQTKARTLYSVSRDGKLLWTYSAPCMLAGLRLLSDGTAVGLCDQGKQLFGFKDGRQTFARTSEKGLLNNFVVDPGAGLYALERTGVFDTFSLSRLNAAGQTLWAYPLKSGVSVNLALATDGNLYVTSTNNFGTQLWIFGNRP